MSDFQAILKTYWGYDRFRPLQEDIVKSAAAGEDTLALMPTGGGKSITFQVPALAKEGICLVITPLIALMKDQVENLRKKKIKALAIHSGMSREEISIALDNCIFGDFKFLYLSPERLATKVFISRVQQMNVNLVAIDEAHCISQWGYDFRPSYLKIAALRKLLPGVSFLALTATATPDVARDIMDKLAFPREHLLKKSFARENLIYVVRHTEDKMGELLRIIKRIGGTGIVYVRNRKKTREIAELLQRNGVKASYYHAGLKHEVRMQKQERWGENKVRVMVATNAFGMGIDKSDVRFVIHTDMPDSPEAYFQEAGRAGRDEERAWAILLHSPADNRVAEKRVDVNFPDFKTIREVYNALFIFLQLPYGAGKGMSYDFIIGEFLSRHRFNALIVHSSLKLLSMEGYLEVTEEINNPSRVMFLVKRDDLYKFQVNNPELDGLVKLLLRSYSGLFTQYVPINEDILARRAGISREAVYKNLVKLSSLKVINFIPQKQNPVITFLEERLDEKNLHISADVYKFRKDRYISRIKVLLDYVSRDDVCRSRFLLSYFGEKDIKDCGLCDVCRKEREHLLSQESIKAFGEVILEHLKKEPADLRTLQNLLDIAPEKVAKVIEFLIEEKKITRRADMKFQLREK